MKSIRGCRSPGFIPRIRGPYHRCPPTARPPKSPGPRPNPPAPSGGREHLPAPSGPGHPDRRGPGRPVPRPAFLLGVFPLKDTDIFWHLRTGQIIRETGQVPRIDFFTFTREGAPWIDLHWLFQIAVSWLLRARGRRRAQPGQVRRHLPGRADPHHHPATGLADLGDARRVAAGAPGARRPHVRPARDALAALSLDFPRRTDSMGPPSLPRRDPPVRPGRLGQLARPVRARTHHPRHGVLDAALRPGSLASGARRWWRIVGIGSLATFAACLVNPYGLRGRRLSDRACRDDDEHRLLPQHRRIDADPRVHQAGGARQPPVADPLPDDGPRRAQLPPPAGSGRWRCDSRRPAQGSPPTGPSRPAPPRSCRGKEKADARSKSAKKKDSGERAAKGSQEVEPAATSWRLSLFRLLLFAAFSYLSLQATRNSHQFAAVVGSVTAWNFAEWAAAIRRRRAERMGPESAPTSARDPVAAAGGRRGDPAVLAWVGSGLFYRMTGEGRTISLGEEPLFFAHEAARFSGRPEMPRNSQLPQRACLALRVLQWAREKGLHGSPAGGRGGVALQGISGPRSGDQAQRAGMAGEAGPDGTPGRHGRSRI